MKKILNVSKLWFLLDDDFEASLADALRKAADYLDIKTDRIGTGPCQVHEVDFKGFKKTIEEGGRYIGLSSVQELNNGKWINLPSKAKWKISQ